MKNTNSNNVRGSHALLRQSKKKCYFQHLLIFKFIPTDFFQVDFIFFLTLLFGLKISGGDYFFSCSVFSVEEFK